jgi:membrane protease YdiL (CAAX protease family)
MASSDGEAPPGVPGTSGEAKVVSSPPVPPGFWVREPPARARRWVPASRADGWTWVLIAVVAFLVGQIVALVIVAVAADVAGDSSRLRAIENLAAPPAWYIASGLIGLWVGFIVGPFVASRLRGTRHLAADVGLAFRPIDVVGVAIGIGGQLLVALIYLPFISHLHDFQAPTTKVTGGAHGGSFVVIAVLTVVGAPFFEEVFFRGLLFRGLLGVFGVVGDGTRSLRTVRVLAPVLLDGLLFGLAHAELEQLAGLAVFGCILALVAFKTKRLGMNIVSHATFNLVAILAIASSRSGLIH